MMANASFIVDSQRKHRTQNLTFSLTLSLISHPCVVRLISISYLPYICNTLYSNGDTCPQNEHSQYIHHTCINLHDIQLDFRLLPFLTTKQLVENIYFNFPDPHQDPAHWSSLWCGELRQATWRQVSKPSTPFFLLAKVCTNSLKPGKHIFFSLKLFLQSEVCSYI